MRQAQQTLGAAIMGLLVLPIGLVQVVPAEWTHGLNVDAQHAARLAILGLASFVALDAAVMALAVARFRRARLIAD